MANKVVKIIYDKAQITETYAPMTINIVCHTDGEPDGIYWVWEIDEQELKDYFRDEPEVGYNIHNEELLVGDAERFVNDEDILEDSDEYECGKEPVYGCWYCPLTMEQINQCYGL